MEEPKENAGRLSPPGMPTVVIPLAASVACVCGFSRPPSYLEPHAHVVLNALPHQVASVLLNELFAEWQCRWKHVEFIWSRDAKRSGRYLLSVSNSDTGRSAALICSVYCDNAVTGVAYCGSQCVVEMQKREGDGSLCHMLFRHMRETLAGRGWCAADAPTKSRLTVVARTHEEVMMTIPELLQLCAMATSGFDDCAIEAGCTLLTMVSCAAGTEWLRSLYLQRCIPIESEACDALQAVCDTMVQQSTFNSGVRRQALGSLLVNRLERANSFRGPCQHQARKICSSEPCVGQQAASPMSESWY
jgi:hypothetical protein